MLLITALATTCISPVDFGADPTDDLDDTVQLQSAIDATPNGGTLCIPRGHLRVHRRGSGPGIWDRFAAVSTHHHGLTVQGVKGESFVDLVGDQGAQATTLWAINAGARNIVFDGVTFTSTGAWNTDEQTHLVATNGICSQAMGTCTPIDGLTIRNSECIHPRGVTRRGDCIRLLGDGLNTLLMNVVIEDNILDGARSCVGVQRGVRGLMFRRNICKGATADQHFDMEVTGWLPGLEVMDVVITENKFISGPSTQGDYDIAITTAANVEIYNNQHIGIGRGISVVRSSGVSIHDETIWMRSRAPLVPGKDGQGVIEVSNTCSATRTAPDGSMVLSILRVTDNKLVREGSPGPMVRIVPHGTGTCDDAIVSDNAMTQSTPSFGVYSESSSRLKVLRNQMTWTVPGIGRTAVYARGIITPVIGLEVDKNVVVGNLTAVTALDASPHPIVAPRLGLNLASVPVCVGSGCPVP